jgi:Sulfotransferase domain
MSHNSPELVYKLVHITRNPCDNLISRFHHEYKNRAMDWTIQHPKNGSGFNAFCRDIDSDFVSQYKGAGLPKELYEQVQGTMCHDEVISYVQWHNHAFDTSEMLGVPKLVLHHEDYEKDFNSSLSNLLHFLELPQRAEPLAFHSNQYN